MNFNSKLFLSTFILIFLAELGDKTQLAAMAKSIEGRFTVFLAASSALICSTLIAVLFGDTLTRFVPERYLQIAAGTLFVVFGALMIRSVIFSKDASAKVGVASNAFKRFITETAMVFEEVAEADYRRLAAATDNHDVRRVLLLLADEERSHLQQLHAAQSEQNNEPVFSIETESSLPQLRELLHDVAKDDAKPLVEHAIEHEEATARFYEDLARSARGPSLRRTLRILAEEERNHAGMLQALTAHL